MSEPINHVILSFLDRMIDESVKNTEALTSLKSQISEQRDEIENIKDLSNLSKTEIKSHISDEVRDIVARVKDTTSLLQQVSLRMESEDEKRQRIDSYKKLDDFIGWMKNPKTYITLFIAVVVAVSSLIGGVYAFVVKVEEFTKAHPAISTTATGTPTSPTGTNKTP